MRMPALSASTSLVAMINTQRTLQQELDSIEIIGAEIASEVIFDRIEVIGSAGGAEFSEYWLEYGIGEVPNLWFPLETPQTEPKFSACLHKWDTSDLAEGRYTLRLSVKSENGDIKRAKIVVNVAHEAPLIVKHEAQPWLVGNKFNSVVMWETEALTTGKIEIVDTNGNINRTVHSDAENLLHIVNMSDLGVPPGHLLVPISGEK